MCCIGALIVKILKALHHEVVGTLLMVSSNHRILYNTHIYYQDTTLHLPIVIVVMVMMMMVVQFEYYHIYHDIVCVLYRSPHS